MNRTDLKALREKYEEMLRLRRETDGSDPRRRMADLASRFPGALREIDDLPLASIEARVHALGVAEEGGEAAAWMEAIHLFHTLTRGALCAKKWLSRPQGDRHRCPGRFRARPIGALLGEDAGAWSNDLAQLADPPRGRVPDLGYDKMSALLDLPPDEERALVFGAAR